MFPGHHNVLERLKCRAENDLHLRPDELTYLILCRLREQTKLAIEGLTELMLSDIIDVDLIQSNLQDVMDEYRDCIQELHKSARDPL